MNPSQTIKVSAAVNADNVLAQRKLQQTEFQSKVQKKGVKAALITFHKGSARIFNRGTNASKPLKFVMVQA